MLSDGIARLCGTVIPGRRLRSAPAGPRGKTPGPARVSWLGWTSVLWLATAIVVGSTSGVTVLLLNRAHETALQVATQSLLQTAQAAVDSFDDQIVQVDSALASLPGVLSVVADPSGEVLPEVASRLLRSLDLDTFAFRDLLLLHADGSVWAAARSRVSGQALPFDIATSTAWSSAVTVAGPIRNALTGDWTLFIMRRVVSPNGEPMLAVAELPLRFLVRMLSEAGQRPGLQIAIESPDDHLLVTAPFDETSVGRDQRSVLAHSPEVPFALQPGRREGPTIGVVAATDYTGVRLLLTLDEHLALSAWTRQHGRVMGAVGLGCLMLLGFAVALTAALRQHERAALERDQARTILENAIEAMADGFVIWDEDDRLVTCNSRYRELYARIAPIMEPGVSYRDVLNFGVQNGQYPEAQEQPDHFLSQTFAWHRCDGGALERRLPDGTWLLITDRRMADGCVVGMRTDITAVKQTQSDLAAAHDLARAAMTEVQQQNIILTEREEALESQYLRFDAALNNMSHGLLMADASQNLIVCNRRFLRLFGIEAAEAPAGLDAVALFHHIKTRPGSDAKLVEEICRRQSELAAGHRSETFVVHGADGRAISVAQQPMDDDGWVATYEDVTQHHRVERQVRFLAHHDPLTGLANRALFNLQITEALQAIGEPPRGGELIGCALLYLDLDRFKDVNDTLGHPVGDALLEAVASRLLACLGPLDFAARLGGDEFAVACRSPEPARAASALSATIIASLGAPFAIADRTVSVGVSIGIALATLDDHDTDTLLRKADMALYSAKASGRGVFRVFEPDMEATLRKRLVVVGELRHAVTENQLELVYQPIVDLRSGRATGFEALVRWRHPDRGLIGPADFIPLAEETGLIDDIGAWVLDRACSDIASLPEQVTVAVNLSPVQLRSDRIIEVVAAALSRSGLAPSRLELEITETALLDDGARTTALLGRCRGLGLRLVLDDFGTGFSSLSHLRTLPLNKIKIDRSFVTEITTNSDSSVIVRSILRLAGDLGMMTTAEGVETVAQLEALTAMGCTQAQGYLLGRPKPILQAIAVFRDGALLTGRRPDLISA